MSISRKHIPEPVVWDQTSILREIAKLKGQISTLTNLTGNPSSDTRGIVTRNVRDYELISAIERNSEVLERIQRQLSFITGIDLETGEG